MGRDTKHTGNERQQTGCHQKLNVLCMKAGISRPRGKPQKVRKRLQTVPLLRDRLQEHRELLKFTGKHNESKLAEDSSGGLSKDTRMARST